MVTVIGAESFYSISNRILYFERLEHNGMIFNFLKFIDWTTGIRRTTNTHMTLQEDGLFICHELRITCNARTNRSTVSLFLHVMYFFVIRIFNFTTNQTSSLIRCESFYFFY